MHTTPENEPGFDSYPANHWLGDDVPSKWKTQQFDNEVFNEITRIRDSDNRRVATPEHLSQLEQHMLRVFDRLTVLLSFDVQTWNKDRSIITEIGIAIYDPRQQELALSPNIKNYHFIIRENREYRNDETTADQSGNFGGGISYLFAKVQMRQLIDGLMRHYFGPEFPLNALIVGHGVHYDIKYLENLDVFIHPNVPTMDTQDIFILTHGREQCGLKNALAMVNQPYSFLLNAGNFAYYTIILALKLCDPMVRRVTGIDYLKENEFRGVPIKYKRREENRSGQRTAPTKEVLAEIVRMGSA